MTMLGAFHFIRPLALLLCIPALLLWHLHWRRADMTRRWRGAIEPALLDCLLVPASRTSWLRPGDALLAAWLLGAIAVAGPTWERVPSPFAQDAPPVMIVLRVTPSMAASDLPPSRLGRAQEKISDLLKLNAGRSFGLIAYAGSAHLVLPPTRDADVVVSMARALAPDVMPQQEGDDLSGALTLAARALGEGGRGGSVLVLADEVSATQIPLLRQAARTMPVSMLAMLPAGRPVGALLARAASTLGARIEHASIDDSDVASIRRNLVTTGRIVTVPGERERWRDMGWFLVPPLALIVLLWFRRGWVVLE